MLRRRRAALAWRWLITQHRAGEPLDNTRGSGSPSHATSAAMRYPPPPDRAHNARAERFRMTSPTVGAHQSRQFRMPTETSSWRGRARHRAPVSCQSRAAVVLFAAATGFDGTDDRLGAAEYILGSCRSE